ncbi:MAG: hypothetical protein LC734_04115, partial [Acidobacteria bacterium]|nr:hypothetical protein [Acidobacteriota bacterium]
MKHRESLQSIAVRRVKEIYRFVGNEPRIRVGGEDVATVAARVDVDADETFAVEGLRQIGVEIHKIAAKLGKAFFAQEVIGQSLDLPDRIETVDDAFPNLA